MATQIEWNFIFLIYADLRYDSKGPDSNATRFNCLIGMLKKLPLASSCNLFVITNIITVDPSNMEVYKDTFACVQYLKGEETGGFPCKTADSMDAKPCIIGSYLKLIDPEKKAKRTALFTWDHGSVFGINRIVPPEKDFARAEDNWMAHPDSPLNYYVNPMLVRRDGTKNKFFERLFDTVATAPKWLNWYKGAVPQFKIADNPDKAIVSTDNSANAIDVTESSEKVIDMLSNEMIRQALCTGGFNLAKKLDVVCMMNCCMQNIHTQFALCKFVKFLVAPQSWIYFPGYDYVTIFNNIFDTPDISARNLSSMIIQTCKLDALSSNSLVPKTDMEAIFAIDLQAIESIANWAKAALEWEKTKMQTDPALKEAIYQVLSYSYRRFEQAGSPNYSLVDMLEWYNVRTNPSCPGYSNWRKTTANSLFWTIKKHTLNSFIGSSVYKIGFEPSGFAMSLPSPYIYRDQDNQPFIRLFYKPGSKYESDIIKFLGLDSFYQLII